MTVSDRTAPPSQVAPGTGGRRRRGDLGPGFAAFPAGTGARIGAWTVDFATVAGIAGATGALTSSWLLAAVAALEVVVVQWVWQARRGLTVGTLVTGTRVSRDDGPYSPGATRALVRSAVTAAGLIVAVVGAWVVAASSAWDHSPKKRSWADAAAGTVTARVPRRGEAAPAAGHSHRRLTATPPTTTSRSPEAGPTHAAAPVTTPAPLPTELSALPPGMAAPPQTPAPGPSPLEHSQVPDAEPEAAAHPSVLLTFDTGQRAQCPTPCAINLGRTPSPTEPGDTLLAVEDPARSVSRTHLRVEHSRGRTWVIDGGSTNGSSIMSDSTSTRLVPGVRTELPDGDRVRIGDRIFTVAMLVAATVPEQETP